MNDFDELIDADVAGEERARLERVHGLLVEAGPPPELPVGLQHGYRPDELELKRSKKRTMPRKIAYLAAAVIVIGTAFAVGFATGSRKPSPVGTLRLSGTAANPQAHATLDVLPNVDGNWPMTLTVRGLPAVTAPTYYVVWLERGGKLWAQCGSFVVSKPSTLLTLQLNAPYALKPTDSWVVTRETYGKPSTRTTVLAPRST